VFEEQRAGHICLIQEEDEQEIMIMKTISVIVITKLNFLSMKTLLKKHSDIFFGTPGKFRDNRSN
jgi:hypothetical protein